MFSEFEEKLVRGREIRRTWSGISEGISLDVKNQLGMLYIQHVLQLSEETAVAFLDMVNTGRPNVKVWDQVGIAQSVVDINRAALKDFWRSVRQVAPGFLPNQEDEDLFNEVATIGEVRDLILGLNRGEEENHSYVIDKLVENVLAYK